MLEDEHALREDLIGKIISKVNEDDGMLSRAELGSFTYAGQTIRVIDSQRFAELLLKEKPVTAAL